MKERIKKNGIRSTINFIKGFSLQKGKKILLKDIKQQKLRLQKEKKVYGVTERKNKDIK